MLLLISFYIFFIIFAFHTSDYIFSQLIFWLPNLLCRLWFNSSITASFRFKNPVRLFSFLINWFNSVRLLNFTDFNWFKIHWFWRKIKKSIMLLITWNALIIFIKPMSGNSDKWIVWIIFFGCMSDIKCGKIVEFQMVSSFSKGSSFYSLYISRNRGG